MNQFEKRRARKRVSEGNVKLAKTTISRRDDLPDEWEENFEKDDDGIFMWTGENSELSKIRSAMKEYEENEAGMGEDKMYYDARTNLQFLSDR